MIAPARLAAAEALRAIDEGTDLPTALHRARAPLTDRRDQALLTELVSGTVRMRAALDYQLARHSARPIETLDPEVRRVLRLGAFQLLYLARVPASAVVNDAVRLARVGHVSSAAGFINAVLRATARVPRPLSWPDGHLAERLATEYSHPQWLVARWLDRLGEERTRAWLTFNNLPPSMTVATNRTRGTRDHLASALAAEGVATQPTRRAPDGLQVTTPGLTDSSALKGGLCLIQEEASQLLAHLGTVPEGGRVLDLCAAPGGKTMTLAARVGPTGLVVACDVRPRRLRVLRDTVRRCQLSRVRLVQVPPEGPLPFAHGAFDLVLVDAPCSGLGTLRRDPDIRWKIRPEDLARLSRVQTSLLDRAAPLVARGGQIVYATCSSEPDENEQVVEAFLATHPEFTRTAQHQTSPPDDQLEAFAGSVLTRAL
jgi:16S rRNA (cytosine967-C5)-methyltransferase